jgi:ABC-type polysaccharide/polyol phosphate export permease
MNYRSTIGLCSFLTRAELQRRHARSSLGAAWGLLLPLVSILVTWWMLDATLNLRRTVGDGYGNALVVGLAVWLFVSEAINASLTSITTHPQLVKKTVFPAVILPISTVLASAAIHLFVLAALVAALMISGVVPTRAILTLPFWLATVVVFTASLGVIVAALNVVLPDSAAVVTGMVSLWFWLTPIVWPLGYASDGWRLVALANPLTPIIEGYRHALLGSPLADGSVGVIGVTAALATAGIGGLIFSRVRPLLADAL